VNDLPEGNGLENEYAAVVARIEGLLERRRHSEARSAVAQALQTYPDDATILYFSGFIDWIEDRLREARATVDRLLELNPEHYGGRVLLAHLDTEAKRPAEAERTWIALLRDYPEDSDLYAEYAGLMLAALNVDKARRLATEGLRFEPEHAHCLSIIAICDLIDGHDVDVDRTLGELARAHPEHLRTGLTLVTELQERGNSREALRVAQGLLRAQPDSESLVGLVRELRASTHWSMRPLYPIQRWGWKAAIGLWVVVAFGLPRLAPGLPDGVVLTLALTWLAYVVYSWVWPAIIRRIV